MTEEKPMTVDEKTILEMITSCNYLRSSKQLSMEERNKLDFIALKLTQLQSADWPKELMKEFILLNVCEAISYYKIKDLIA
jgi:hypothetical protein